MKTRYGRFMLWPLSTDILTKRHVRLVMFNKVVHHKWTSFCVVKHLMLFTKLGMEHARRLERELTKLWLEINKELHCSWSYPLLDVHH